MMSICFADSRRTDLRPLTCHGIPVGECHGQLIDLLSRYRHIFQQQGIKDPGPFFAEPVTDPEGTSIDWYSGDGADAVPPVRMTDLAREQQARAQAILARYAKALSIIAGDLAAKPGQSMHAAILRAALKHPSTSDLYVQGGRILLVNWGYESGTEGAVPENIIRGGGIATAAPEPPGPAAQPGPQPETQHVASAAAPVPPVAPATRPRVASVTDKPAGCVGVLPAGCLAGGCLAWLWPLLLLLLLLWLLLCLLGHRPSPVPDSLFRESVDMSAERQRSRSALSQMAVLYVQVR